MYRGYATYRAFLNAKLHALSAVICGDDELIDSILADKNLKSVKELSTRDASELYQFLLSEAKRRQPNADQVNSILGKGRMTDNQRNLIIKVTKYNFHWSPEATFSYIVEMFPDYRKRLSLWEVQNSKLGKLFSLLTAQDADRVIKRLLAIEKRNSQQI